MKQRTPEEILNHHFDTLHLYGEPRARLIETDSTLPEDSASLFTIVQWLWQALQPVQPSQTFRDELLLQLQTEYERQRVQQHLGIQPASRTLRPIAWIVPVAVGTASLVGVYAFWRRSRHITQKETALAA
jgi:hypothetical protein